MMYITLYQYKNTIEEDIVLCLGRYSNFSRKRNRSSVVFWFRLNVNMQIILCTKMDFVTMETNMNYIIVGILSGNKR
jgi:hypothetical protein